MKEDKPKKTVGDILREIEEKKGRPIPNRIVAPIKKTNKVIVDKKNIYTVDSKIIIVLTIIIFISLVCYFIYKGVYP